MKEIVNEILARLVAPGVVGVIDWYKLVGENNETVSVDKTFTDEMDELTTGPIIKERWAIE